MSDQSREDAALDPAKVARWKARSLPVGVRMIVLGDKAEDSGLTGDEEAEYGRLKAESARLLREFLEDLRSEE